MRLRQMAVSFSIALTAVTAVTAQAQTAATGINVFLSAPKNNTPPYADATTETFESLATGNRTANYVSAIGTYQLNATTRFNIQSDNQYGSGTGNYMAIGVQSGTSAPVTLLLNAPAQYFGFSWNAGDGNNTAAFYSGTTLIGTYKTSTVLSLISGTTVTGIDGQVYQTKDYYGKPSGVSAGSNKGEPYAFISFVAQGGTFDRVVFGNSGNAGTGFETDNHSIRATAPTPTNGFIAAGQAATPLPEPATLALLLPLGVLSLYRHRRQLQHQA